MVIPRLVATDLDGTLLRSDGTLSGRTLAALDRVRAAGTLVAVVTGRPPRRMAEPADRLRGDGLAICANGAIEYDLRTRRVLAEHAIPPDVAREIVRRLRGALPELTFAAEYRDRFAYEPGHELGGHDSRSPCGSTAPLSELVALPCVKLLARHPRLSAGELVAHAVIAVGDLATPVNTNRRRLVEICARGVDKATSLARLCERRGILPSQVMAFGDMPNDLPMLAWAGRSYAVANAHPAVLEAVRHHAPGNDDDGVAAVLETLYPRLAATAEGPILSPGSARTRSPTTTG
ncbi:Cof-type HAD-IIB family hydrolase [Actinomadura sp. ATCC 31491]|uniref:Cof-type HAD-IIB family hydrolase n=1 Tax=Actinomadura luzonensis TaxID=2805427 RepID=A0ABT0FNJ7_9ACTN|nr:HAD family hydrolase [Actinomadura luzonensis]MCK2213738.1 Cof-type HAD-IIB family hydrolase [Actinomadura luzonensis]